VSICGKRLRVLAPVLVEAMEHHGHLQLAPQVRSRLLDISAATIARALRAIKQQAAGNRPSAGPKPLGPHGRRRPDPLAAVPADLQDWSRLSRTPRP
jgi:hypothetical protein